MQRWILGGCYPKGDGETSVEVVGGVCFIVFFNFVIIIIIIIIIILGGEVNLADRDESGRCCL